MQIPPELYGPFGALVVLAVGLVLMIRGDIVPGYMYRRERDARDKADTVLLTIADVVKAALERDRGGRGA